MVFYKKRNFIWLLGVTMLLTACGGKSVINFLVRDDSTKYPLSDVRISIKSDSKEKVVKSNREGKARVKWRKNELPRDYILPYTAEKEGYPPLEGNCDVFPPSKPHYVSINLQKKTPNIKLDLQGEDAEPGKEIECSAEIRNIGTADLTQAQLGLEISKDITFKGWDLGGRKRSYESRLPLETIKPKDIKNYSFFVETNKAGTFEIVAILKSKELPEISKKSLIKVRQSLPELSLDLEEDKPKQIIKIVIKNIGRGDATAIEVRISACCDSENKDIDLDSKSFKNIPPGEEEIIMYLIEKVKDKGLEGEVRISASGSCKQGGIPEKTLKINIPKLIIQQRHPNGTGPTH